METRKPPTELLELLRPHPDDVVQHALWLRRLVLSVAPATSEVVFDTYNAVSVAFTYSERWQDAFCHLAVYSKHVNLGFNRGAALPDPDHHLQGTGKQIRHLSIRSAADLNEELLRHFLELAHAQVTDTSTAAHDPRVIVRISAGPKRRPQR